MNGKIELCVTQQNLDVAYISSFMTHMHSFCVLKQPWTNGVWAGDGCEEGPWIK